MPAAGNSLLALTAAASWGGGDFSGGMGVKAAGGSPTGALRMVNCAYLLSLSVLLILLAATGGLRMPHGWLLWWGASAGVIAGMSLTAFYVALSRGAMGVSAAISGLLAAAIPAVVSSLIEGAPTPLKLAGFAVAAAAIWVIAAGPSPENIDDETARAHRITMALAIFGGLGFGYYFVALRMDNALGVMMPIALSRAASLTTCVLLLAIVELRSKTRSAAPWLTRSALGWACGVALLDTGGNLLLVSATRAGRLDVAAVLASLYPAATILLAAWRLHERPTRRQAWGMVIALIAVVMITL